MIYGTRTENIRVLGVAWFVFVHDVYFNSFCMFIVQILFRFSILTQLLPLIISHLLRLSAANTPIELTDIHIFKNTVMTIIYFQLLLLSSKMF